MTRNQLFTTLEFINDTVRMVLGEYYNDKFYVYEVFEESCNGLNNGEIVDEGIVENTIKSIRDTINFKHDVLIEDVILSFPSDKLTVLDFTSSSPVTGKNSLISEYDIKEAYDNACKVRHDEDKKIISVVPIEYQLDNNEIKDTPPIKYKSSTFKTLFNVLLLPSDLFDQYIEIVNNCNLKVSNYFLDKQCLYSGIVEDGDLNLAVLDINKYNSSLTFFKRGKLFSSYNYIKGSYDIENDLVNKYEVKTSDLDRVTYILGNANIDKSNKRSVYKNDGYEKFKYLSQYKIDEIINEKYTNIITNLVNQASKDFDINGYDIYLTGKGNCIKNSDELFTKLTNKECNVYSPKDLCMNNPSFVQTVGLIRLNYKKLLEDVKESNQEAVNSESDSKFDKFILDETEFN